MFGGGSGSGGESPKQQQQYRNSKNGYGTLDDCDLAVDDPAVGSSSTATTGEEADPVMTIFESRNTQRVRFTLGGTDGSSNNATTSLHLLLVVENHQHPLAQIIMPLPLQMGLLVSPVVVCVDKRHNNSNGSNGTTNNTTGSSSTGNIKQFMSRALFGSRNSSSSNKNLLLEEEMAREVQELGDGSLIWESATTPTGPEVIHTHHSSKERQTELLLSFTEDPKARAAVSKLLSKAHKAEHVHFRYEYAVKCYLKAVNILKKAKYPDDHPTVTKTVTLLNNAHHVLSSYNNSANIVKMGIKNEDAGELVKALKMYTIAYRIRRDNLSRNHPSLVVLLNMLGSIQIKRGELKEAMQIYELGLE